MAAQLIVQILADASKAVSAFKKTGDASADTSKKVESTGSKIAKLAGAVATGYAVTKVVEFGKSTVEAASTAAVANKRLAAVFAQNGDATGEAARQAEEYADKLGRQIGVNPSVIKGAQAVLATFHDVSNATGRAAGLFDGATRAAADLAAAGFGDLTSNSKQLGKALEDPTKGMASLRRVGVVLTQTQQDQIKNMQKSGDLLGAQKTLLGDVNAAVGGTAAKTATAGAKMGVAYDEMKVKLGTALLPAVKDVMSNLSGLFTFVDQNSGWLIPLIGGIVALAGAFLAISKAIEIVKGVMEGLKLAWALLNTVFAASPIGLIIIAVVALVAAIVLLWLKCAWFRDAVKAVWNDILGATKAVWNAILAAIHFVWDWLRVNWPLVLGFLTGPIGLAVVLIQRYWSQIVGGISGLLGWIARAFSLVFGYITAPFSEAWGWLSRTLAIVGGWFAGIPDAIGRAMSGVFQAIIYPFSLAWGWVQDHVISPLKNAWNAVARTVNAVHISSPELKILGKTVIPGFTWSPPFRLPILDQGGIVSRPTLALLAANSQPEAVIPLSKGTTGTIVHVHMEVNVPETSNPAETGRAVAGALRSYFSAGGRLTVPA